MKTLKIFKTLLLASLLISTWIMFHELTHIALNGFRFVGTCALDCPLMSEAGLFGNGYTPFGVFLEEPVNPLAREEGIAHTIGIYVSVLVGFFVYKRGLK